MILTGIQILEITQFVDITFLDEIQMSIIWHKLFYHSISTLKIYINIIVCLVMEG